jgi:6-phosphogluconate dehydrogenase
MASLLTHAVLAEAVRARHSSLKEVVAAAVQWEVPAPALMASLAYLEALRSARLPANLVQAQRDCFGAHTYERIDRPGRFYTDWESG